MKAKIFSFIEKQDDIKWHKNLIPYFILLLIILNVLAVMFESIQSVRLKYKNLFHWFEIFSVVVFTIEYLLRVWVAEHSHPKSTKLKSKFKFIFSFYGLVDLFAILPFYLPVLIPFDLRFIRIIRLLRLFRILKIARYSKSLKMIGKVLKQKKEALILTLFVCFLLLLIASSLMYYIEHEAQPEEFPDIFSSFWWAIATLTTIGYGDVYPVTALGKFLSGIIALLGIGLIALPTGIIGAGFIEALEEEKKKKDEKAFCPYCGKKIKE
jgi:voltage-gated potassium channel